MPRSLTVGRRFVRPARRGLAAALAALVLWPSAGLAQDSETGPGDDSDAPSEGRPAAARALCAGAPTVFDLLCASYKLLTESYVDDVPDAEWAAAAARGGSGR